MINKNWRQLLSGAKLIFTPVALLFIGWFAWQSKGLLVDVLTKAHWGLFVLAVVMWIFAHLLSPLFYAQVFRFCGFKLNYSTALIIHARYLPARYIPGGIWHTVGRIAEFRALGFDSKSLAVFLFFENCLAVAITFLLGALLLCSQKSWVLWDGGMLLIAVLAGGALLVIYFIVNLRIFRTEEDFSVFNYLLVLLAILSFWLFATMAFVLYVGAASDSLNFPPILEIAGIYLFSWGVGFISLFAPQGVGVFEGVVGVLVESDAPITGLVVVVAGFRVVVLAADVLVYSFIKFSNYIGIVKVQTDLQKLNK